jgi:response regulator RpfG family c-di-GMP phosphodiesterase
MPRKRRILIIDDHEVTLAGLEAYLGQKYNILTASNGREGIRIFEKNQKAIHLVLTDLIFPDLFGDNIVAFIKMKSPKKPVIAMTGWEYHPEEVGSQLNADLILKKPFEMDELDQVIEKIFSGKKSRSKPNLHKNKK